MKRLKTLAGSLIALGGLILSSCGVLPDESAEPGFEPLRDTEQDKFLNKIFETNYLSADLDVKVAYTHEKDEDEPEKEPIVDNYYVTGSALFDINSLDNIGANVDLELDMNNTPTEKIPVLNLDFTYVDDTAFLDVNGRSVKLETDKFSELLELLLGSGNDDEEESEEEPTNLDNSGIKDIVTNIVNMSVTSEANGYKYVSKTTGDQPDMVFTSDFDFNITSFSIYGIKYRNFTIDIKIDTQVLSSLDQPIVNPDPGDNFINLTNYFGVLRKFRAILDDEKCGLDYDLALTHYEPKTPDQHIYLGDTQGHFDMDLKNSIVSLQGDINISDIRTDVHDAYTTSYKAEYFGKDINREEQGLENIDKGIYLDYLLKNSEDDSHYMLNFSNKGLQDMWELMGDEEVFGINLFDLIFGASDKEYPIIDILTDSTYRYLAKYGEINLDLNYVEVQVDNTLFGGLGYGSVRINLEDDKTIRNVTIVDLDINSYIVNGSLSFVEYEDIEYVTPSEYHSLDGLDGLIRSGASYFRSNQYNLGLDIDITNTANSEVFSVDGKAHINVHTNELTERKGYDADVDVVINDFGGRKHTLLMNANPEGGEQNVYAQYKYKKDSETDEVYLKLKASRDSISALFDQLTGYTEDEEGKGEVDIMKMIAPYITGATKDTLHRILKEGDYFAVLRDETIKSITCVDNVYTVVLAKEAFGFEQDFRLIVTMENIVEEEETVSRIKSIEVFTQYDKYEISATVTLNNNETPIPVLEDKSGYIPIDDLSNIFLAKEAHLDIEADVDKIIGDETQDYVSVTNGKVDFKINEAEETDKDIWDRLYARIEGNVLTSGGGDTPTPFILGYDQNLSLKFGNDAKVTVTRDNVRNIIDRAKNVLPKSEPVTEEIIVDDPEEELDANVEGNINMFLKVMEVLAQGDYAKFLNAIKSTSIQTGVASVLNIELDNSLFREGDTTTSNIAITFSQNGIAGISVSNLRYNNFALTGSILLKNRERQPVDVTGYNEVYNIVDALLNTATPKDVVLGGQIKMRAKFLNFNTPITRDFTYEAFVHKEDDAHGNESVYGYLKFSNVPFVYVAFLPGQEEDGWATYKASDNRDIWKNGDRTFEIYFSSEVNYDEEGHTIPDGENEVSRTSTIGLKAEYSWKGEDKVKEKYLTSDDFMNDMTYYLLNYGLGIKARNPDLPDVSQYYGEDDVSSRASDSDEFLDFHNYNIQDNYSPNLSKLLKSYAYYENGKNYTSSIYDEMSCSTTNQAWVATIDGGNLLNNNMLGNVELFTHTGVDGSTNYLNKAIITTEVSVSAVTLAVGATLDYYPGEKATADQVQDVKDYIAAHPVGYRRYNEYHN